MAQNGVVHVIDTVILPLLPSSAIIESRLSDEGLTAYPNPASSRVAFIAPATLTQASLQIISTTGQTVYNSELSLLEGSKVEFDVSGFENGIYIIRLVDEATIYSGVLQIVK